MSCEMVVPYDHRRGVKTLNKTSTRRLSEFIIVNTRMTVLAINVSVLNLQVARSVFASFDGSSLMTNSRFQTWYSALLVENRDLLKSLAKLCINFRQPIAVPSNHIMNCEVDAPNVGANWVLHLFTLGAL